MNDFGYAQLTQDGADGSRLRVSAAPVGDWRPGTGTGVSPNFVISPALSLEFATQPAKFAREISVRHADTMSSPTSSSTTADWTSRCSSSPSSKCNSIMTAATLWSMSTVSAGVSAPSHAAGQDGDFRHVLVGFGRLRRGVDDVGEFCRFSWGGVPFGCGGVGLGRTPFLHRVLQVFD